MKKHFWVNKQTYETRLIADEKDLDCAHTEVQMVRFPVRVQS